MTKLLLLDGILTCPVCDVPFITIEHKHQVAVEAHHASPSRCPWTTFRFRANPITGDAEQIKSKDFTP